jgi:hypothetical protein
MRIAKFDQTGALCVLGEVALKRNFAHLIEFSA